MMKEWIWKISTTLMLVEVQEAMAERWTPICFSTCSCSSNNSKEDVVGEAVLVALMTTDELADCSCIVCALRREGESL